MRHVICSAGTGKTLRSGPNSFMRSRVFLPCAAIIFLAALATIGGAQSRKEKKAAKEEPPPTLGVQLEIVNGYPELRVDGHPFFIHAAEFDYFRVPRDLWSDSLDRYRDLGINTIDIRIPWNWHEPTEGNFDFDGHTNPRRDLRSLLKMIAEKGFRLIARPGPTIEGDWLTGGAPGWILSSGEFRAMVKNLSANSPIAGPVPARYDGELILAVKWLAAVAPELAPYSPSNTFTIAMDVPGEDKPIDRKVSGPLLFVFLGQTERMYSMSFPTPEYWKYLAALRGALLAGGVKPGFEGAFAVSISRADYGVVRPAAQQAIGSAGEWFLAPNWRFLRTNVESAVNRLDDFDADTLALLAQSLRMQQEFPPLIGSFQAGWYAPVDDSSPPASDPANTLLASRWLIGQGITGIEYSPLQDTLTPPGYQTLTANREFRWDAALNINGTRQPRARAVERNARMLAKWGEFLATSHPRAAIGIVDVRDLSTSAELSSDAAVQMRDSFSYTLRQIERVTSFAGYPAELVDPEHQPVDSLLHDPVLLLEIPAAMRGQNVLPEKAQTALLDYVRRGGTLVCSPAMPLGAAFSQALGGAALEYVDEGLRGTKIGAGQFLEWGVDAFSWTHPVESFAADLARPEASWAAKQLHVVMGVAGSIKPIVSLKDHPGALLISELAANVSAAALGAPTSSCGRSPSCGAGLISATNWSSDDAVLDTLTIVPPAVDAHAPKEDDLISLPVEIPPRESLLLPVNIPLCTSDGPEGDADSCDDKIVAAGAEFMGASRSGNALDLMFYAPVKATVKVKLESAPLSVELPVEILVTQNDKPIFPERTLEGVYNAPTHVFTVEMPRGAAPDFVRVLRLHLDYTPRVPELPKPSKHRAHDFRYSIADSARLPLGRTSLATDPPLIPLAADGSGHVVIHAKSESDSWITVEAVVEGAAHGSERLHLEDREEQFLALSLLGAGAPNSPPDPKANPLQPGTLSFTGDRAITKKSPLMFLLANGDDPVGYEYDFERSGSKNWVLENKNMRLILLPGAGGEIEALVDKSTDSNLTTTVGGLRDLIHVRDAKQPADNIPGGTGTFIDPTMNLPYHAQWETENGHPAILLEATFPEDSLISGTIKKTIHLETKDGGETVEVHYLSTPIYSASKVNANQNVNPVANTVTAFSVPAAADAADHTQFCWFANSLPESAAANSAAANPPTEAPKNRAGNPGAIPTSSAADGGHCSPFVARGAEILLPAEAKRVEVRTVGQPTLAMEWDAGRASIEQKQFSARLLLELPASGASGNDAGVHLRYTILHEP